MGPLIIISGPAGSGKTTVVSRLLQSTQLPLRRAVTATTRPPRPGEIDGKDYHFWSRERFEHMRDSGQLLEFAEVHGGHYYGTPKSEVMPFRERGMGVILVIDVQGAATIRRLCPDAYSIFLRIPDDCYAERMRQRGDDEAAIQKRIQTARMELQRAGEYNEQLINDDLDETVRQLEQRLTGLFPTGR